MTVRSKEKVELALAPRHLALVRTLLRTHAPRHHAYAFGSRVVSGPGDLTRLKPHSDLDLALEGPPLKPEQSFALREAFSESKLPMRVDFVEVADLPLFAEAQIIKKQGSDTKWDTAEGAIRANM